MSLKIDIQRTDASRLSQVDMNNIPFGKVYSDHMLTADYIDGQWTNVRISPYAPLTLDPATAVFHYGQEIFEGMKAFYNKDDEPILFRPDQNFARFNKSAVRMCMPEVPENIFMDGLKTLVNLDKDWIPNAPDSALYIRPFMISTDEYIGVKPSKSYKFMIITCPVGAYYAEPLKVKVETNFIRAAAGGIGFAKAGANYGGALYPARLAQEEGYHQLLWTDARDHKYFEESGTMNVFFVIDNKVVTPQVSGTILDGVTRKSAVQLLKDSGYDVEERRIAVTEVIEAIEQNRLQDAFGAGTAATIAPIVLVGYEGKDYELPQVDKREVSNFLLKKFEDIRSGEAPDTHNWVVKLEPTTEPAAV